jgi:fructose-bisphosphate aldolase class II
MMKHYDEVMMIDGEIGAKKSYDPRTWLKLGEAGVCKRMMRACDELKSTGKTIFGTV